MMYPFLFLLPALADPQDVPDETEEPSERTETDDGEAQSVETLPDDRNIPELDNLTKDLPSFNSEEDEDLDFSFLRGSIDYSIDAHYWTTGEASQYITSFVVQGDPQYLWEQVGRRFNPSLGLRFRLRNSSTLSQSVVDELIGITAGLQSSLLQFNTGVSYHRHHLFKQTELERSKERKEILYSYQELPESKGILWENTILLQPQQHNWFLEANVSFPFQLQGARQMGDPFTDSFRVGGSVGKSIWLFGYEYSQFPGHQTHLVTIGNRLTL